MEVKGILTGAAKEVLAGLPEHSWGQIRELAEAHRLADPARRNSIPLIAARHVRAGLTDYQRRSSRAQDQRRCQVDRPAFHPDVDAEINFEEAAAEARAPVEHSE